MACNKTSVTTGSLPVPSNALSCGVFVTLNAMPDEHQSPEEPPSFPLSKFNWMEHLAAVQVPVEWLGSHQAECRGLQCQGM